MIKSATPLQTVKVSKPQLLSHHSHRSSTASHEHSSDYASDASSAVTEADYETPPSRNSTSYFLQNNCTEMTFPQRPAASVPAPTPFRHREGMAQPVQPINRVSGVSPPTPGYDDTPYIRFALEQITFDEEVVGPRRSSNLDDNYGISRSFETEDYTDDGPPTPVQTSGQPNHPVHTLGSPASSLEKLRPETREQVLMPIDPPTGDRWNSLGYVPVPLRITTLAALVVLCLLMIVGLICSNIYVIRNHGLYDYNGNTTSRYFIFQYLPQILGAIILLWLFVVQAAIYRVTPYFCMSEEVDRDDLVQNMPITPANFVLPDMSFFRLGQPLVGAILLVFWLMNFTLPLLACLYQTQFFPEAASWRWSTVQGLAWFLVAWYFLLVAALLCCMICFRSKDSALMWDPSSIADTTMLFHRSNILMDYARSEVEPDLESFLPPRSLRLGFWTPSGSHDICHAVGQVNMPLNRLSLQGEKPKQTITHYNSDSTASFDFERLRYSDGSEFTRNIHSPFQRYRWCPWFLKDSSLLAWIIAAFLLVVAFLVVSFVNRAVQTGFDPQLPSATESNGFSPSNFLYSFLPTLLATWLFLFWQSIDTYFRSIQPYANLTSPQGTTAKRSLLQSYVATPPIMVTIQALLNQDWKLAYITLISLMSITIPILAGGVFTAQLFRSGDVRMVASMPGYIAMSVFLCIYAFSFMVIWPTRKRYLPHPINTIAGQLSFLYASPLLNDPAIRNVKTKAELAARLSGEGHMEITAINEKSLTGNGRRRTREWRNEPTDREPKYAFGIFVGRDGKEHLGIDRLQRPGSGEMLVTTGNIRPSRSLRSNKA